MSSPISMVASASAAASARRPADSSARQRTIDQIRTPADSPSRCAVRAPASISANASSRRPTAMRISAFQASGIHRLTAVRGMAC